MILAAIVYLITSVGAFKGVDDNHTGPEPPRHVPSEGRRAQTSSHSCLLLTRADGTRGWMEFHARLLLNSCCCAQNYSLMRIINQFTYKVGPKNKFVPEKSFN